MPNQPLPYSRSHANTSSPETRSFMAVHPPLWVYTPLRQPTLTVLSSLWRYCPKRYVCITQVPTPGAGSGI